VRRPAFFHIAWDDDEEVFTKTPSRSN